MQKNANTFQSILDFIVEYGRATIKMLILKALDKISDLASSSLPKLAASFALLLVLLLRAWIIAL